MNIRNDYAVEMMDENFDEYFSDGNTGATKETFKVSKKQLREQARNI